jgi:uncharacterized protein YndB with AHSA1/START domain
MTIEPVRKEITVDAAPEKAFEAFTDRIGSWWPHDSHSIAGEHTADVILEGKEGGRLYEVVDDGTRHEWGTVVTWDPPRRLVLSWYVGRSPDIFTEIEVQFAPERNKTKVSLEHRHWERLGATAAETRDQYDGGWDIVLGHYITSTAG